MEVGGGSRRIAAVHFCVSFLRRPRTTGKRIRPCPPPGLKPGLLLYFPDSLPRHPRPVTTVVCQQGEQPIQGRGARALRCATENRTTRSLLTARRPAAVVDQGLGCCVAMGSDANGTVVASRGLGARIREVKEEGRAKTDPGDRARTQTVRGTVCAWRAPGAGAPGRSGFAPPVLGPRRTQADRPLCAVRQQQCSMRLIANWYQNRRRSRVRSCRAFRST